MGKPKCEDIGFEHCWKDTTPNIVYATNPPSYPPKQRKCSNCGLAQTLKTLQPLVQEWQPQPNNPAPNGHMGVEGGDE